MTRQNELDPEDRTLAEAAMAAGAYAPMEREYSVSASRVRQAFLTVGYRIPPGGRVGGRPGMRRPCRGGARQCALSSAMTRSVGTQPSAKPYDHTVATVMKAAGAFASCAPAPKDVPETGGDMMKTERMMSRWGLVMAGESGPVLAGMDPMGADWRTSTPLVELDTDARTALTASGRPYRLVGSPDAAYALMAFRSLWNAQGVDVRVLDPDEAAVLVARNRPFDRTADEQAAVDAEKLPHVASQVRLLMAQHGLDAADAAHLLGVDRERLEAFVSGDVHGWTVEEADKAFDALAGLCTAECRRMV